MIQFTQYVGDAPGTTTMQMNGLGICPPGYYGQLIPNGAELAPASQAAQAHASLNPYATDSTLSCPPVNSINGLGLARIRWDLVALAFGVGFAGILGFALYKGRRAA